MSYVEQSERVWARSRMYACFVMVQLMMDVRPCTRYGLSLRKTPAVGTSENMLQEVRVKAAAS